MVIFITEIIVKWIDSFTNYWKDGWNISDFAVTIVVCNILFYLFILYEFIRCFNRKF